MADVIPFRAVRPPRDKASLVATRSYISYTPEEQKDKLNNNPYSFLHIIHPEGSENLEGKEKFKAVRDQYETFLQKNWLVKDESPCYYIYSQQTETRKFTGIIGGISIDDYESGHIKKHEHTLTLREKKFKEYLSATKINAEPVLLTYPRQDQIERLLQKYEKSRAEYEFTTTDQYTHKLWPVHRKEDIELIKEHLKQVESVYIADGHHRSASSLLLGKENRSRNPGQSPLPSDYFLAYLISDAQMEIKSFHRLTKTLNGLSPDEFLSKLEDSFTVEQTGSDPVEPDSLHTTGMYLEGTWFRLTLKPGKINAADPVEQLDCHILSSLVLKPILGIMDEKTDQNIAFSPAPDGIDRLIKEVDSGSYKAAFTLAPVTVDQLKNVADNNLIMPPKSTWVEPKLRSGLTIYDIDEF